ncbi:unnamed protein product [Bubo scandiacus]
MPEEPIIMAAPGELFPTLVGLHAALHHAVLEEPFTMVPANRALCYAFRVSLETFTVSAGELQCAEPEEPLIIATLEEPFTVLPRGEFCALVSPPERKAAHLCRRCALAHCARRGALCCASLEEPIFITTPEEPLVVPPWRRSSCQRPAAVGALHRAVPQALFVSLPQRSPLSRGHEGALRRAGPEEPLIAATLRMPSFTVFEEPSIIAALEQPFLAPRWRRP